MMLTPTQQLQSYYLALFGRAADPAGLAYWQEQMESSALEPRDVLLYMLQSDEFTGQRNALPDLPDGGWVNEVYQRLFARDAEQAGIDYWSEKAREGASPQVLIESIMTSASATDKEALDAYASIAQFYSQNVGSERYDAEKNWFRTVLETTSSFIPIYKPLTRASTRCL